MAYNLGDAYINVIPSMKGGAKSLEKEFSGVGNIGARAGRSIGESFRKAFRGSAPLDMSSATKTFEAAQAKLATASEKSAQRQKRAQEDVAAAREKLAGVAAKAGERVEATAGRVAEAERDAARAAEQAAVDQASAKRKVEVAQARYNETLSKNAPESAKALAAADQLARAEENLNRVASKGADAQAAAKKKVASAQEDYAQAVKEAGSDSDAARRAADELRIAEQQLEASAADAADEHRRLSAEVDDAKKSLDKASGSSTALGKTWDGLKSAGAGYKGIGDQINAAVGPKLWNGLKVGALAGGAAVAGAFTGSLVKGFNRLKDIENAEAKLTGLGHSAESVQSIMDNALASVKGTSFGLGEAAGLAGTLVASGIKPGQELEKTLKLTADSATIAGRELGDMGLIWGSVAAKGKLQGDDAMQLLSSGVPIWQMVADVMGVTAGEAQELGSKGKVSFEIFREAMEKGVGGAALKSGKTTEGAFKNMGAAMGRFGATLLKDVYPLLGPLFGRITGLFDYLEGAAGPAMEAITGKLTEFGRGVKGVWDILANGNFTGADNLFGFEEDSAFVGFLFGVRDVAIALYEKALKPLGTWIGDNWKLIGTVLGGIVAFFAGAALVSAIGAVGGAIAAFVAGISWVGIAIGAVVGGLTYFFTQTEAGQAIVSKAWDWIQKAVAGVVDWFMTTAWPALQKGWDILKAVASEVIPVVVQYVQTLGDYWSQIFMGVILPAIQQFVGYVRDTMFPIIQRLWTDYVQPAFAAIGAFVVWAWENAIKPALSALFSFVRDTLAPTIVWLWENVVSPVFTAIGNFIGWAWENVIFPALDALKYFLFEVLPPAFQRLWETVKSVWDSIKRVIGAVVGWFQTWVWPVLSLVIELAKVGFNSLRDVLKTAWMNIRDNIIAPVVTWFRDTAWPILSSAIESVKGGFNLMRDSLKAAWSFIKDTVIAPVANWFRDTIQPLFKTATDSTGSAFSAMKDTIKKAWDGIRDAAKAPIRFVVDTVINDALIGNFNKLAKKLGTDTLPTVSLPSGFARGGVLPGMSRMSDGDDQLVPMRRGEGVLVSEGLRTARDRAAFLAANAAGRRGIGFASLMQGGFAGGGIWDGIKGGASKAWSGTKKVAGKAKDLAGDALDKVLDGADFVAEALKDPSAIFKKVYDAVAGQMPGAGGFLDVAKGAGGRLLSGVIEKVKGAIAPTLELPDLSSVKAGGSLAMARTLAGSYGLTMTSHRRGGARTAGSGSVSLHASGRAMDFSNSSGPTPQMMAFFNAMHGFKPTELLYSPAGGRQWRRSGKQQDTSGATKRGHYNHVHVGFNKGGIFDQGGMMQPGMTGINLTKKPEAVLDPRATRAYQAHAEAIAGGRPVSLSDEDRALLRAIAGAVDLKVDGRSVVSTVRDSFKQARMPLVTA